MTPRKISVHQLGPQSSVRDGAADTMLLVRRLLGELGFTSDIFIDGSTGALPPPPRRAGELRVRPQDLLLIHHRHSQGRLDWLAGLRCRKTLVYHATPPARGFAPDNREQHLAIKAHTQLAPLRAIVDSAIALSSEGARRLRQRGFAEVTTIPLFKDWSGLRGVPFVDPLAPGRPPAFRLVNIGRFAEAGEQRGLVRFAARCGALAGLPVELTLIGKGEPDPRYRAAVADDIVRWGLGDRIVVIDGPVNDAVIAGACRTANAYLSLADGEPAAAAMVAAMALDLPVVAYAGPGIAEHVGDAALLIGDREPATIAEALLRLRRDRALRRDLVRWGRAAGGAERSERLREELRRWLVTAGAYETRGLRARLAGWRAPRAAPPDRPADRPAQYVVESDDDSGRQLALALDRLPPPAAADRTVTIRCGKEASPSGLLGDLRLVHVGAAAAPIPPARAALINLQLDGVVAASHEAARVVRNSGVNLPIAVIGRGFDDIAAPPASAGRRAAGGPVGAAAPFTFLCLGGAQAASGIEELLTAYCLAFTSADPVLLVISAPPKVSGAIEFWVKRLAGGAYSPPVQLVPEPMSPAERELLYGLADAAILPVPGDGSSPAALALASAIPLIAVARGEHLDYCDAANALLLDYAVDLAASEGDGLRIRLSVPDLVAALRAVYGDGRDPDSSSAQRARRAQLEVARRRWSDVAARLDEFVDFLDHRPVMNRKIRLAWVSTYNSRCGLATHSGHLLEHFDRDTFDITVIGNHQEPLKPDPANVVRLWPDRAGSLASVRDYIRNFDAVFVNFHFSLMEIHDLAALLTAAQESGIDTFVTVHKTLDTVIDGRIVSLREIAAVLGACTRVIVHTAADIARLKSFGVVDNVMIIPPGVIDRPALNQTVVRSLLGLQHFRPIVGTFGFLLPPKGLQQLIHAFALVLRHFPEAMLLMLNAEFPGAAESVEERQGCQALIGGLGLEDRVRLVDEFLDTDEILLLLNACDVTVFTYQDSTESDSGAVRLGLAAGRPVATTPLPVFANLQGVVHQLAGAGAADIADGLLALLADPARSAAIVERQREWIAQNSWAAQAARIGNVIRGCFEERHRVELRPPAPAAPAFANEDAAGEPGAAAALRELVGLVDAAPQDWRARRAR